MSSDSRKPFGQHRPRIRDRQDISEIDAGNVVAGTTIPLADISCWRNWQKSNRGEFQSFTRRSSYRCRPYRLSLGQHNEGSNDCKSQESCHADAGFSVPCSNGSFRLDILRCALIGLEDQTNVKFGGLRNQEHALATDALRLRRVILCVAKAQLRGGLLVHCGTLEAACR